jgi:hypothetical protein
MSESSLQISTAMELQASPDNAAAVWIGDDTVRADIGNGFRLAVGDIFSVPDGVDLRELFVSGTAGDALHYCAFSL